MSGGARYLIAAAALALAGCADTADRELKRLAAESREIRKSEYLVRICANGKWIMRSGERYHIVDNWLGTAVRFPAGFPLMSACAGDPPFDPSHPQQGEAAHD